jgi:hypothetical protein
MRTVRVGTIVWGVILLAFAAVVFCIAVFDLRVLQAATLTWVLIGVGGVLVLAALIAAIARAVSGASPEAVPQGATAEATSEASAGASTEATSEAKKPSAKGQPVD